MAGAALLAGGALPALAWREWAVSVDRHSEGITMSSSYSIDHKTRLSLKEQLRLFAFDITSTPPKDLIAQVQDELSKRDRLMALLEGELNFHGESTGYASHDLHAFAAKFPPQLPRAFIRGLTAPGNVVLDPMMGSGTAIVIGRACWHRFRY